MPYTFITLPSPVGELKLVANGSRLAAILWENDKPNRVRLGPMSEAPDNPILIRTARQLEEYFSGTRDCFDLELDFAGTDFQKKVWAALLTIPFGETRTYDRQSQRRAGSRRRQRTQPDFHCGAVSSGDRRLGETHRVCRWARGERALTDT
jgi:methylated-DNA-[protein]-cysteine S-methyltransferase